MSLLREVEFCSKYTTLMSLKGKNSTVQIRPVSLFISCTTYVRDVRFGPSKCSHGKAFCIECGVLWVRIPPEAARSKVTVWVCCVALPRCLYDLACFFLPSFCITD